MVKEKVKTFTSISLCLEEPHVNVFTKFAFISVFVQCHRILYYTCLAL